MNSLYRQNHLHMDEKPLRSKDSRDLGNRGTETLETRHRDCTLHVRFGTLAGTTFNLHVSRWYSQDEVMLKAENACWSRYGVSLSPSTFRECVDHDGLGYKYVVSPGEQDLVPIVRGS